MPGHHRHHRRHPDRNLPASGHPARSPPAPGLRAGQALPPALGDRVRLLRDQENHAGPRVLRARTLPGITQEIYALLTVYQALRIAITDTTLTAPGTDPDRASFTTALQTARDQVIQAAGIIAAETIDLAGTIGRHVLDNLLPARRLRLSPRAVKRPLSRYAYKSQRVNRHTYNATISIDILMTNLPSP